MWGQIITLALGLWLMAAPSVLGYGGGTTKLAWIVGPLVATFAVIALSGVTRVVRWVNVGLGGALVILGVAMLGSSAGIINLVACGTAISAFAVTRGRVHHRYGGGWRALFTSARRGRDQTFHQRPA